MICVAISDKDYRKCLGILQQVDMAEIRLDLTEYDEDTIDIVFAQDIPTVATCRPDNMTEKEQYFKLRRAIEAGATYVDIEYEAPKDQKEALIKVARENECKVIISYHNYHETPGMKELFNIVDECYDMGADVAKLATMVKDKKENARILSMYSVGRPIVALGMGELGKVTRLVSPLLGAEFTFASQDDGEETAPGQITYSEMKKVLTEINQVC